MQTFKEYVLNFNKKKKKRKNIKGVKWFVPSIVDDSSILSYQALTSVSNLGTY